MKRLLAVFPLGLALFFTATSIDVWGDFIHPKHADMRLMSFGVAWIQTIGAIFCWVLTIGIALDRVRDPAQAKEQR